MNNKGQTLILFVMLIPIVFILIGFVIDIGFLYAEKIKLNSVVKDSMISVLNDEQYVEDKLEILINKNIKNINIKEIRYENNILYVKLSKEYKTMFSKIFKSKSYDITVSYKAYKENNKIKIKKE